ncbi:MAG: TonB family protein [Bacteroidales bacterium]|nr:TonB family protein [Bacteroidales bacterium]
MSNRSKGIVSTIAVHTIAVLLLYTFGFSTPLPLPAEQGILINFGNSEDGMGADEPKIEQEAATPQTASASKAQEDAPLTQDTEEAPSLPVKKKDETKKVESANKTTTQHTQTTTNKKTSETPTEKPREANKKALFPGQKADGGTTGEGETGKAGNQGGEEGSVDSPNRVGSTGGGGDAERGISVNLNGRTVLKLPQPEYPRQKSGKVVVEVTVDKQGNVTKAKAGVKGSTTLDSQLLKAAEKAALNAKFNIKADAPASQIGTITYIFRLQ